MHTSVPFQRVIIVGATSGIGKACARLLAGKGVKIGITGRRKHLLEELSSEFPDSMIPSAFDATSPDALIHLQELVQKLGGLDLLLFSSGWGQETHVLDETVELKTIALNVTAFTTIIGWAFRYFAEHGGHIAAISSIAGLRGSRYAPSYGASKAYQINYLEGLWCKAKKEHLPVCVTDIRPGFVDTAMAQGDKVFWSAPPEKAADQILHALRRTRKYVYITKRWSCIAWLVSRLPSWILQLL